MWAWASYVSGLSPHATKLWTAGKQSAAEGGAEAGRSRERPTSNLPEGLNPLVAWVLYENAHCSRFSRMNEKLLQPADSVARHIGDRCHAMLANTNGVPATPVYQLTSGAPVLADVESFHSDLIHALVRS